MDTPYPVVPSATVIRPSPRPQSSGWFFSCVVTGAIAFAIAAAIYLAFRRKNKQKSAVNKTDPATKTGRAPKSVPEKAESVASGYIRATVIAENGEKETVFLSANERIFLQNRTNPSLLIHTTPTPEKKWSLREHRTKGSDPAYPYVLETEVDGRVYTLQDGAPGAGIDDEMFYGLAYVAPAAEPIGKTVRLNQDLQSSSPTWDPRSSPEDFCTLGVENGVVLWKEAGAYGSLEGIEFVQGP